MQFQRLYHFDVELVRETMSVQEFHYVHTMLLNHQDMMMIDKKDALTWGKRSVSQYGINRAIEIFWAFMDVYEISYAMCSWRFQNGKLQPCI